MSVKELLMAIEGPSTYTIKAKDGTILEDEVGPKEIIKYLDDEVSSFKVWVYDEHKKLPDGSPYTANLICCTISLGSRE